MSDLISKLEIMTSENLQTLHFASKWTNISPLMEIINIHQAKTNFSRLVDQVIKGEQVIIGKAGKPVAKLVPYTTMKKQAPKFGMYAGQIKIADDFDAESAEINELFYREKDA
jgi:prevent-host-death family protein